MTDPLWKKIERAAADKAIRASLRKRAAERYRRSFVKPAYRTRIDADAAKHVVPEDTRSLTAAVFGDPLSGRSALDKERAGR
jgi:hypothetical protein